jgi:hypothetical protein
MLPSVHFELPAGNGVAAAPNCPVALLVVFGVLSMLLQPVETGVLERTPALAAPAPLALVAVRS